MQEARSLQQGSKGTDLFATPTAESDDGLFDGTYCVKLLTLYSNLTAPRHSRPHCGNGWPRFAKATTAGRLTLTSRYRNDTGI